MANGNGKGNGSDNGNCGDVAGARLGLEDPFTALKPHFGMLLGVEDLSVLQSYARGKMRLHNAWLHGGGAVWGLGVRFDARPDGTVLAVDPGLALDGAGRELFLSRTACVDLGQWFEKNRDDASFGFTDTADGGKSFGVSVVACFRACLDRPVPAISSSCDGGTGASSAFSRVSESVDLLLRPRPFPAPPTPYPRLRALFQIGPDQAYDDVRAARGSILALPPAQQPQALLAAVRRFGALDEIELEPQQPAGTGPRSLYPDDPGCVVLADIQGIVVKPAALGGWALVTQPPDPDVTVRRALIGTATIQDLLCGPGAAAGASPPPSPPPPGVTDAGGPRVDAASIVVDTRRITFKTTAALADGSVSIEAFEITAYDDAEGWFDVDLKGASFDAASRTVTLDLKEKLDPGLVRIIARGTGPMPLLGTNKVPLAGVKDGPPAGAMNGRDFVFMKERT